MSAVADRSAEFNAVLVDREREVEELRAKLVELRAREEQALADAITDKPAARPFGDITSSATKARRARVKAEERLAALEEELPVLRAATVTASREGAEREMARLETELRKAESTQPATWRKLQTAFADLVRLYMSEAGRISHERRQIDQAARALFDSHGDLRERWELIFPAQQVRELPASWPSAVRQLEHSVFEADPALASAVRDRLEAWVPTGMGAAMSGRAAAGFGTSEIVHREIEEE